MTHVQFIQQEILLYTYEQYLMGLSTVDIAFKVNLAKHTDFNETQINDIIDYLNNINLWE